ncbi:MAG: cytochrome c oxidase subunit II [Candidatus Marinimicrobia bacterium]|nr:cytochrome c oxidase subunit II [Candidatus Neomarinimicrobiota bacterium]MBT3947735.1 cytochrome c oxidase subunit II [Candidatus Neomarinimicrobiota bacterium]MBT4063843.1 cytochrome c oxidase subunit II [Candidatus Neomarinimicrobiota bacterium]MBT4307874.1 cytochrome c oxidase subunit II [Candidatus Neomarinimicrobiota bacterium]MBT4452660.1 cytochrome c oxidase subunit II [Candidatus Neomarinimicrobiota bacterium]
MLDLLRKYGLPINASSHGGAVDEVIVLFHWLMLFLFIGWGLFFIYTLIRFRASKNPKADYVGVKSHLSSGLEVAVAAIEFVILIGFAIPIWATRVNDVPNSATGAEEIRVIGQQFAWNIHYPGADGKFGNRDLKLVDEVSNPIGLDRSDLNGVDDFVTVNQLHIPVNKPIRIDLSSKDVIHSFSLPEFRVKQDAVPGMSIPVWFEANMTTDEYLQTVEGTDREGQGFEIACAQLCGLGHYRMKGFLTVHDNEGYAAWLDEQAEYLEEEGEDDDWGDDF